MDNVKVGIIKIDEELLTRIFNAEGNEQEEILFRKLMKDPEKNKTQIQNLLEKLITTDAMQGHIKDKIDEIKIRESKEVERFTEHHHRNVQEILRSFMNQYMERCKDVEVPLALALVSFLDLAVKNFYIHYRDESSLNGEETKEHLISIFNKMFKWSEQAYNEKTDYDRNHQRQH
jgi:hypothetical protein